MQTLQDIGRLALEECSDTAGAVETMMEKLRTLPRSQINKLSQEMWYQACQTTIWDLQSAVRVEIVRRCRRPPESTAAMAALPRLLDQPLSNGQTPREMTGLELEEWGQKRIAQARGMEVKGRWAIAVGHKAGKRKVGKAITDKEAKDIWLRLDKEVRKALEPASK